MIGYVLIITLGIVMGVMVYAWVKTYLPREELKCSDGVSVYIEEARCYIDNQNNTLLSIDLRNNGRFGVSGYYIKASNKASQETSTKDISRYYIGGNRSRNAILFNPTSDNSFQPNNYITNSFNITDNSGMIYSLEILPIRMEKIENKKRQLSCENAKIKEKITCGPWINPTACDADGDTYQNISCGGTDCNDTAWNINPGRTEICTNGVDDDCDGNTDIADGDCLPCIDTDSDGYGNPISINCPQPQLDCNNTNASINPGATELCGNSVDEDCSGIANSCPTVCDTDGDGHDVIPNGTCNTGGDDCDDTNININPGATEICGNGIDEDCSGSDLACSLCIPTTCLAIGKICGIWQNGTGTGCNNMDCGTCPGTYDMCINGTSCLRNDTLFLKNNGIQGLVSWWRMNGNMSDEMGLNNGTCIGTSCPASTTGKFGGAYNFDGNNDYIDVTLTNNLKPTSELSVVVWAYPESVYSFDNQGRLIANAYSWSSTPTSIRGWVFGDQWGNTTEFAFEAYNSSGTRSVTWDSNFFSNNLNRWTHVVGVFKKGQYPTLYINKNTSSNVWQTINSISYPSGIPLRIGARSDSSTFGNWDGSIDELMIFNRSLNSTEISTLYGLNLSM